MNELAITKHIMTSRTIAETTRDMKELIKIHDYKERSLVNARELHSFLGSRQEFANWIKNRILSFDFIEGGDYIVFDKSVKNSGGGRPNPGQDFRYT